MGGDCCETSFEFHARENANVQQQCGKIFTNFNLGSLILSSFLLFANDCVFLSLFIIDILCKEISYIFYVNVNGALHVALCGNRTLSRAKLTTRVT